jgi:hypothetical protein
MEAESRNAGFNSFVRCSKVTPSFISPQQNLAAPKALEWIGLWAIFSLGFFGYLMNTLDWFDALPGDLGDPRFNSYVLEHLFQWVTGQAPKLWSPAFFYPYEGTLAFSDNHFGTGWIYVLMRGFGLDREHAYAGWFAIAVVLNFWATYYALRKLGFSVLGAGAGAFTFAFGLAVLHKEAHAQLTYRFAIPLAFCSFYLFLCSGRLTYLAQTAVWGAIQFYASVYLGVFLGYLLIATALSYSLLNWRTIKGLFTQASSDGLSKSTILSMSIVGLCALLVAMLLYQYQAISLQYGFRRSLEEIMTMLPRPASYLIADRSGLSAWLGRGVTNIPMRHEHQMFFGLGASLIASIGCLYAWRQGQRYMIAKVASLALLILVLLTTTFGTASLYNFVLKVPGLSSIRAVSRVVLVMMLPLAILVAVTFDALASRWRAVGGRFALVPWVFFVTAILALTLESVMYQPYNSSMASWVARRAEVEKLLPSDIRPDTILYVTKKADEHFAYTEIDAMIVAQDRGLATLNGYSGNAPPGYTPADPCLSYKKRLHDYFLQHPASPLDRATLEGRTLTIFMQTCPHEPFPQAGWIVDWDIATRIGLALSAQQNDRGVALNIGIKNLGTEKFSSQFGKGPIRLSWRFVPIDQHGRRLTEPSWAERRDMTFTLQPSESYEESFVVQPPKVSGYYELEASLVQEGVRWFHDLGMTIPKVKIEIKG